MTARDSSLRCVEICADIARMSPLEGKHLVLPSSIHHEIMTTVEGWFEERGAVYSATTGTKGFQVPAELWEEVVERSKEEGRSLNEFLFCALNSYVHRKQEPISALYDDLTVADPSTSSDPV